MTQQTKSNWRTIEVIKLQVNSIQFFLIKNADKGEQVKKQKVNSALELAIKVQRGCRSIALLFNLRAR